VVAKGQDWTVEWRVLAPETVQLGADAAIGADALTVLPLEAALASGDKLLFGENTVVTLDGAVAAGAESVPVTTTTVKLRKGDVGQKIRDLTGYTVEFELSAKAGDATPLIADADVTVTVLTQTGEDRGKVQVAVPDTETDDLAAGSYFGALWRRDAGSERPLATASVTIKEAGFLS
jgi:hypothetical protein